MIEINTKENIRCLREILQKEQKVAVFVGTGASNFLGIKGWKDVLEEMAREFGTSIDVENSIGKEGYARTATKIFETKKDINFYKAFMSKQFQTKSAYHFSLHIKIINLFNTFLTTNYDTSFQAAFHDLNKHLLRCNYKQRDYKVQKLPVFNHADITGQIPTLVYLHGNNENEEYIFKEDEYIAHYPSCFSIDANSRLEDLLKFIFREFALLFIGFSFDDLIFVRFYRDFRIREKSYYEKYIKTHGKPTEDVKLPEHFIVMSNKEVVVPKISKSEVDALFGADNSWEKYFGSQEEKYLVFKENAEQMIIKDIEGESNPDIVKRKKYLYDKFTLTKHYLLRMAYLRPITFEDNDYIQIEDILNSLSEIETDVAISINEAAYAK